MEVPACCPYCDQPFVWEVDLHVDRELGWEAPNAPAFLFRCAGCQGTVRVLLGWSLERGSDPRPLRLVGGPAPLEAAPHILLVDRAKIRSLSSRSERWLVSTTTSAWARTESRSARSSSTSTPET